MKNRVLIVDDSKYMRTMISDVLTKGGFEVIGEAASGEAAIDMAFDLMPDFITLDNILPDMVGVDVLKVLKNENGLKWKIIMVSAVGQQSSIQEGLSLGASDYLVKPFTSEDILESMRKASLESFA